MHMHPPKAHTLKHTILWLGQTHQSLSEQQIQIHIHTYTSICTQTLSQAKLDMAGVLSMFRDVIHLLRVIVEPDKSWLDTKRLQPSFLDRFHLLMFCPTLSHMYGYVWRRWCVWTLLCLCVWFLCLWCSVQYVHVCLMYSSISMLFKDTLKLERLCPQFFNSLHEIKCFLFVLPIFLIECIKYSNIWALHWQWI